MKLKLTLALILASLPLVILFMLLMSGITSIGLAGIFIGICMGLPFWFFIVLPIYLLSNLGKRWSFVLTVLVSFSVVSALYAYSVWIPTSYTLEVGGKILVEKGVATSLYYRDLFIHLIASAIAVMLGLPVFLKIVNGLWKNNKNKDVVSNSP